MSSDSGPLYLGFDLSTQQLKAIVVASDLSVVSEAKVDFDKDFGEQYGLEKGVHQNKDEGEVYAPVLMFLESIDLVLSRLKEKAPIERIKGISGSCQQHGSVYWAGGAEAMLAGLKGDKPLVEQLKDAFSRPWAPNWQDSSTQAECDKFEEKAGSPEKLAEVTGSAAHHRFTGTQIMRIRRREPEVYAATSRISLVSSFLASVLLGFIAPMDISDVCGMNLWDIPAGNWSEPLLELTAGGSDGVQALREKLGEVRHDGGGSMGNVSSYLVDRYGFSTDCGVAPFTGDNPGTILSLPLRPLDAMVSLGTSTTFLMSTPHYKPDPSYHFFNHPTTAGQYMFMLCYKNGALAREKIRDKLDKAPADDPWKTFTDAVLDTPPLDIPVGSSGSEARAKLGLYFSKHEIVPNVPATTERYTCTSDGSDLSKATEEWAPVKDARAIVESQALSLRLRSQNLVDRPADQPSLPAQPRRVYLAGGGSLNPAIAKVMGEVLGGVEGVYRLDTGGNACALGGAYKAVWAMERAEGETFDELIGKRWKAEGAISKIDEGYREDVFWKYGGVLGAFEEMEKRTINETKGRKE